LQLLSGAGQGVLHLGLQIVIVVLLVGAGDLLFGLEQEYIRTTGNDFPFKHLIYIFQIAVSVSIASVILSFIVLCVSYLSGQECGRLSRDLSTPSSSFSYIFSSLCWLITATLISVISSVILSVLLYVDSVAFSTGSWVAVPIVLLVILPLLQCFAYQHIVREGCEQRFGWGIMASVIPVRFLDIDKKRARSFLMLSQVISLVFLFHHIHTIFLFRACGFSSISLHGWLILFMLWGQTAQMLCFVSGSPLSFLFLCFLHW